MQIDTIIDNLRATMNGYYNGLVTKLQAVVDAVQSHVNNTDNPHRLNKNHIELGRVANYPPATEKQAREGVDNNSYLTPYRGAQQNEVMVDALTEAFETATNDLQ